MPAPDSIEQWDLGAVPLSEVTKPSHSWVGVTTTLELPLAIHPPWVFGVFTKVCTGVLLLRRPSSSVSAMKLLTAAPQALGGHGRHFCLRWCPSVWLQEAWAQCYSSISVHSVFWCKIPYQNTGSRRNVSQTQNDFQLNYVSRVLVLEILIHNPKIWICAQTQETEVWCSWAYRTDVEATMDRGV